jgi:hypothetical protein
MVSEEATMGPCVPQAKAAQTAKGRPTRQAADVTNAWNFISVPLFSRIIDGNARAFTTRKAANAAVTSHGTKEVVPVTNQAYMGVAMNKRALANKPIRPKIPVAAKRDLSDPFSDANCDHRGVAELVIRLRRGEKIWAPRE